MRRLAGLVASLLLVIGTGLGAAVPASADHFNVVIVGPAILQPTVSQCTWEAAAYSYDEPFSYVWYRNSEVVGTDSSYTGEPGNVTLTVEVTGASGDTGVGSKFISVSTWGGTFCE